MHQLFRRRRLAGIFISILMLGLGACDGSSGVVIIPPEPGVPAALEFRRAPASREWQNQPWSEIEVQVVDGLGDLVTTEPVQVELVVVSGTGSFTGSLLENTVQGVATFGSLSYDTDETLTIRFEAEGLESTDSVDIQIGACTPMEPVKLGFDSPLPASAIEGETWGSFGIRIEDCAGNLLTGESTTVTLAVVGGEGMLSGTLMQPTSGGIATFDDLSYDVPEDVVLEFTATSLREISGEEVAIIPEGPTGLRTWGGNGRIRLRWDPKNGADSYVVYAGSSSGVTPMSVSGDVSPGVDYCESGLSESEDRYYVVTSVRKNIEGGVSGEVMGTAIGPLGYDDTLLDDQWHLDNFGQNGANPCEDADVQPAWDDGYDGTGLRVAVVDDGIDLAHEDLMANLLTGEHHDYDGGGTTPAAGEHGTAVAGIIGAVRDNMLGMSGMAPGVSLLSYNLIAIAGDDSDEADAMGRDAVDNAISSNSWGPFDLFGDFSAPSFVWEQAVEDAVENGRGGLGVNFFWAGGNGGEGSPPPGNSNADGYANFWAINAVCAVGSDGVRAPYSEKGANLLVCGPSSSSGLPGIFTTDLTGEDGFDSSNYTGTFGGTSAATPMVSGVAALILDANPMLTWRDVREILARSARMNDPSDPDWKWNGASPPFHVNHSYGFGMVDAGAAVALAETWTPQMDSLPDGFETVLSSPNAPIPDNNPSAPVTDTISVSGSGLDFIEFVEIEVTISHTFSGNLRIVLEAPAGTTSELTAPHDCFNNGGGTCGSLNPWRFGSQRHMGENPDGDWTITVTDEIAVDTGTLQSWRLHFYGR